MVDLDSDPTKLIDIVSIGKQLLITRGALTTFSLANDIAKYFAIIPAMFMGIYPGLALRGVSYRAGSASSILSRNLLIYGLGGILVPFIGIKLIDLAVSLIPGF